MMNKEKKGHSTVTISVVALVIGMVSLAYASVPLYDLFCRVTGYGGTTQVAISAPDIALERTVNVRFNSDVSSGLPWKFRPEQKEVTVRIGEEKLIFYWAENTSDKPVKGTSIYNVTPSKVGSYFNKVQCFCFDEQLIEPGEKVRFPVSFFIDPEMANDKNLDEVKTITLSYTFFRVKEST